jgi:hypothetical protein
MAWTTNKPFVQRIDGLFGRKNTTTTHHAEPIDGKANELTVNGRISIFFLPIAFEATTKEKSNGKKAISR